MSIDDALHAVSTIIEAKFPVGTSQATAFFYNQFEPKDGDGPQWRRVIETWLVTNRHALLHQTAHTEMPANLVTFNLREYTGAGTLKWVPIELDSDEWTDRALFHPDPSVDIVAIRMSDLIAEGVKIGANYMSTWGLSAEKFAGQNNIEINTASDVLVVGYPDGFYDKANVFPIIKSGVIASRWGMHFEGNPYFLIDAKLFPGSSGSLVISKPTNTVMKNGRMLYSQEKQFALLGVFSGTYQYAEPAVQVGNLSISVTAGYDLGIVWYAEHIETTVQQGLPLDKAAASRS
ncbi:trypsin-like peptidase domain-containing protein [Candidatus Poriferisodalis sp.]|uniref:trypsin-like peptidase domain-containing protein n=1 Tax=Candidatus Poriferisodalis sp. TaxID=3101277 RepID=UPI003B0226DE